MKWTQVALTLITLGLYRRYEYRGWDRHDRWRGKTQSLCDQWFSPYTIWTDYGS